MRLLTALLAATLAIATDGRAQLLPAGEFSARDGRPGPGKRWKLSDAKGRALAAQVNAVAELTPIVVDYDHQTLHAITSGGKAPAAGWITRVEWLDGKGLFAQVDWTDNARQLIGAREYLYFSPVIQFDDDTGEVTGLLMGALVNFPAILGLPAVNAALAGQHTPQPHHENADMTLLASLIAALGLPADTTETTALTAASAAKAAADAAKARPAVSAALAGELGLLPNADEAAALAALTTLKTKATAAGGVDGALQQVAALQTQMTALIKAQTEAEITRLADDAIAAGKFVPAFREQLLIMGRADRAALAGMVAAAPVIPGLSGQHTAAAAAAAGAAGGDPTATAALSSADALRVAEQMGISPEAWAAALKKTA